MKYCSECGAPLQVNDRFCGQCRAPVAGAPAVPVYEKRRSSCTHTGLIVLAVLLAFAIVAEIGRTATAGQSAAPAAPAASSGHHVMYTISTFRQKATASLTLSDGQGGTIQYSQMAIPWSVTYPMAPGNVAYISAQNDQNWGEVTCLITIDGVEIKTVTSVGAYVIATCSGRVP